MNILITGANGQLGNEMRVCVKAGTKNTYFFTDVAELDITDKEAIEAFVFKNQVDVIVNCAAYTAVDKAEDDQQLCDLINHSAAKNLAEVAKDAQASLIHVSTDYVFDGTKNTPYTEEDPTAPLGVYGVTKLQGEQAIENAGCDYLIFRTSWLYSSFGNNFVKTIQRLSAERDDLNVVFDQIGTPTYAADLAALLFQIIEKRKYSGNNGIYHFSNEGVCSWYDFAIEIANQSGNVCDIQPCHSSEFPAKVTRPNFSVLDKTKVKNTFGVKIPHWKNSLERMISLIK